MNYKGKKDQVFNCKHCDKEFGFKGYSFTHTYCSRECSVAHSKVKANDLYEERYQIWLEGKDIGVKRTRGLIRQFVIRRDGDKCNICGITEWNGKPISLWCDHIDGDASNDSPDNFQMVCPNCDSQQDTFGAKNKGNGRKSRGLPQYG